MKHSSSDIYIRQVNEAVSYVISHIKKKSFIPRVALTLGSGLNKLADLIQPIAVIPYKNIPHFPVATVPGHEGTMILGYLEGVPLIGLKGRKHYYEVADQKNAMDIVTLPVHVAASLGCKLYMRQMLQVD
jgi:purine nucleoside phosphorylase